jgi:DNA-directed RNA polymerase subunit K/omega
MIYNTIITMYEKCNLIGTRTEQIAHGAASTLPDDILSTLHTAKEIALKEYELGVIPMKVTRRMPSGDLVTISLKDVVNK